MQTIPEELLTLGNQTLLQLPKTAFFCSRDAPAGVERFVYLWALEQRSHGNCVVSGFHSRLEQSMLRYLLQGQEQPVIYALGRGIQTNIRLEYEVPVAAGRLLFVTPFEPEVQTVTQETADIRNLLVADLADKLFVPYVTPGGNIDRLLRSELLRGKPITTLNLRENRPLLRLGAEIYRPHLLVGAGTALN